MVTLLILINDGQAAHIIYMPERATKPVARPETNLLPPTKIKKKRRTPENTHKLYPASLRLSISRFDELFNGISLTVFPVVLAKSNPDSPLPLYLSSLYTLLAVPLAILLCNLIKI